MKSYQVFMLLFLLPACQKVITVDINDADRKYVIEATVTDNDNSYNVIVSQTLNISDSNIFVGLENAEVTIAEDNGPPVALASNGNGLYKANEKGRPGSIYHLRVRVNGQEFTASSAMPQRVAMDSLFLTERVFFGRKQKVATIAFKDPPGLGNAYRFTQLVDGSKENTIFILNDKLVDGRNVLHELLIFTDDEDSDLKQFDDLRVEMRCINMENYNYWYSLTQSSLGQNQSASPGNPVSNISGGALGYFSANTFEARHIVVD